MILKVQQVFDKVDLDQEHHSEFIDFIAKSTERELVNKIVNKLGDHKLYLVKLYEPRLIEDLPEAWQAEYRQELECLKIVQCKNCKMVYPWCQKFRDELGGNGFCPYGKEIEDE